MSRELNERELEILNRLLEINFPGRDELRTQIAFSKVTPHPDSSGTIFIEVPSDVVKADVKQRVPVEASLTETDRVLEILLHVLDGVIYELEIVIYKGDPSGSLPHPKDLEVTVNQ